jgi:DNA-binding CsgD family transcriptional regulator
MTGGRVAVDVALVGSVKAPISIAQSTTVAGDPSAGIERACAKAIGAVSVCAAGLLWAYRRLEVVRLLVKGFTNQQIADGLGISIETVRKHVSKALEKTGTKTRAGLVARALGR